MLVLGLDASTESMGVAIHDDRGVLAECMLRLPMRHSALMMPLVERVMRDAGLEKPDRVAVSVGPGSFTGLRIGISLAKALAYGWDVPVAGVSTLEAMAHGVRFFKGNILVLMDARKGRVYAAAYTADTDRCRTVMAPWAGMAEDIWNRLPPDGPVLVVGEYPRTHQDEVYKRLGPRALIGGDVFPRASVVAELGRMMEPMTPFALLPQYLRRSEAEITWEQKNKSTCGTVGHCSKQGQ